MHRLREASLIEFTHKKRQLYVWVCVCGGGGGVDGCDVSLWHVGKFDNFVKKIWIFWKHFGKGYKITFALISSVSSFSFSQNLWILII